MAESSWTIDSILQNVMANPELLSSVLSMAGKLSEGFSLFSGKDDQEKGEKEEDTRAVMGTNDEPDMPLKREVRENKRESHMKKHKKLVEALMLYVDGDRRGKFELVLKLLDILELAEELRR
ncbi:MAG: hypothetical protein IJW46_05015 [Clostridia bacterium]|nr:hypothetical protein [Clostridia bacterium]